MSNSLESGTAALYPSIEVVPVQHYSPKVLGNFMYDLVRENTLDIMAQGLYGMVARNIRRDESIENAAERIEVARNGVSRAYVVKHDGHMAGSATLITNLELLQPRVKLFGALSNRALRGLHLSRPTFGSAEQHTTVNTAFYIPPPLLGDHRTGHEVLTQLETIRRQTLEEEATERLWALVPTKNPLKFVTYGLSGYLKQGEDHYDEREGVVGRLPKMLLVERAINHANTIDT